MEVGIVVGPIVRRVEQSSAAVWLELSADAAVVGRAKPLLRGAKKARKQHVDSKLAHTTPFSTAGVASPRRLTSTTMSSVSLELTALTGL